MKTTENLINKAYSPEEFQKEMCIRDRFGISLNKKNKKLFRGNGIRLGVQEVTRYGWDKEEMDIIAQILFLIYIKETKEIPELLGYFKGRKEEMCIRDRALLLPGMPIRSR